MNKINWVHQNCRFANPQLEQQKPPVGHQSLLDFDPPETFTPDPKQLQQQEFHKDIANTGVEHDDPEFIGGFYHVTTNLPAVLHWGALKSRNQLGPEVQGLGGGAKNEAPNSISVTYNAQKAYNLFDALQFAAMAAQNQVSASEIYAAVSERYGSPEVYPNSNVMGLLQNHVVPRILKDEYLEGLEQELDNGITTGEEKYDFMQQLDDALGKDEGEMDTGGDYSPPSRVGFTAPYEVFSKINPENIGIVQLEARKDAQPEHVQQELELRFNADDLRLAPNPIVKKAILWINKICKFADYHV
jgi:hypothetical protein